MTQETPKILVVDDCQNIRNALKRLFQFNDWESRGSASGPDGLELLENEGPFDLVIVDYFMPYMDGVTFIKRVNRSWPETFCLLLTAYPECHDIGQALQQGLNAAVMEKPWNDEILQQFLMSTFVARQAERLGSAASTGEQGSRDAQIVYGRHHGKPSGCRENCWEFMSCGREPGGSKAEELGVCRAAIGMQGDGGNGGKAFGRACRAVAGTLCGGEVQGSFAKKFPSCLKCSFYREVQSLKG